MILSAKTGTNADLFPDVLALYAKEGDRILDATYGKGVFWKNVDTSKYKFTSNDLMTEAEDHFDFRALPYFPDSFDMVVLDPPYAYSPKNTMKASIAGCYQNNTSVDISNMDAVLKLYVDGIAEARRILRPKGILVVKSQDIIQSGKQWWMHHTLMTQDGFICEDLLVLVQTSIPANDPKWTQQHHARKNHSFFIVLRKNTTKQDEACKKSTNE